MAEPLLDIDRLLSGIRWRRRQWLSLALLGLVCGPLLVLVSPPNPSAVTKVLVARTDDNTADRRILMDTDVALLETRPIASAALDRAGVRGESPESFLASYTGSAVTPNVLQIDVTAPTGADATRRAQAVADAFVAAEVAKANDAADAQAKALLSRQAELQQESAAVNGQITTATQQGAAARPGSVQASQASADLDALFARRSGLAAQILDLGSRADDARTSAGVVAVGTRVVDPPRVMAPSLRGAVMTDALVGLVLGLGGGLVLAAVLSVIRSRPILRADVAAGLRTSVVAELPSRRGGRLRQRFGHRALRRQRTVATLAHLIRDSATPILVLEIGCARATAALVLDIAHHIAGQRPVVIVDDLQGGRVSRRRRGRTNHPIEVVSRAELPGDGGRTPGDALWLVVGTVGPGANWAVLRPLARQGISQALLVVRAGRATKSEMDVADQQLSFAGIRSMGAVLLDPYPWDATEGTRWAALHAAARTAGSTGRQEANGHRPVSAGSLAEPYQPAKHSAPEILDSARDD